MRIQNSNYIVFMVVFKPDEGYIRKRFIESELLCRILWDKEMFHYTQKQHNWAHIVDSKELDF